MKALDYEGRRIGGVLVVRQVPRPAHIRTTGVFWLCRCACGDELVRSSFQLTRAKRTRMRLTHVPGGCYA